MKKYQIRTNSRQFGDTFGVYDFNSTNYIYLKTDQGETVEHGGEVYEKDHNFTNPKKFRYGKKGAKFVKQESYDHGTFEMEPDQARKLCAELEKNARGCWVRLYEMN